MLLISDVIKTVEQIAPLPLQEDWDNSGVQVGSTLKPCSGVMVCVDVTPVVIDEAIEHDCNLIISHHPLIFKGLKRIRGNTLVEQSVIKAISAGITIYSNHTAIDSAHNGVSWEMAKRLGCEKIATLEQQSGKLLKLSVMVPNAHLEEVRFALFDAGAGMTGNYDSCSFTAEGKGTFRALKGANPFVGNISEFHTEPETRLDVILPVWLKDRVEQALVKAHPYETPAYEFIALLNDSQDAGLGVIADLPKALSVIELSDLVKKTFSSPVLRTNSVDSAMVVRRVAMCGGAGAFLIPKAIASGAQAFITSDTKYHDFIDYAHRILIVDIGHYESEQCTKDIFYHVITEKFPNFAVYYSEKEKNPINYL